MTDAPKSRAFVARNVGIRRRRRIVAAEPILTFVVFFALLAWADLHPMRAAVLATFAVTAFWALARFGASSTTERTELRVDEHGVSTVINRERIVLPRASIVRGWITASHGLRVHIETERGDVLSLELPRTAACHDLLDELGVAARQRSYRAVLGTLSRWPAAVLGFLIALPMLASLLHFGAGLPLEDTALASAALAALLVVVFSALSGPAIVVIGIDGVAIERRFSRDFVSFGDLRSAGAVDDDVLLRKVDGDVVRLETRATGAATRDALVGRIQEAHAAYRRRDESPPSARLRFLDRGARTLSDWRDALRTLVSKSLDYRSSILHEEDLSAVLADPKAPAERRIGAAIALSELDHESGARKVRIAIDTCASPRLRAALEHIERGDLDPAAIDEATADAPRSKRAS